MSSPEIGVNLLNKIWDKFFVEVADRDKAPALEGRYVNMLITPKKA